MFDIHRTHVGLEKSAGETPLMLMLWITIWALCAEMLIFINSVLFLLGTIHFALPTACMSMDAHLDRFQYFVWDENRGLY
jgi:hypothetical protein